VAFAAGSVGVLFTLLLVTGNTMAMVVRTQARKVRSFEACWSKFSIMARLNTRAEELSSPQRARRPPQGAL
jgi:uncharacterized protein YifE (UPF0438 family)